MNLLDDDKMCNICLKQPESRLKSYEDKMLSEIPMLKDTNLKSLCIWCVTALKKISRFLTLILESQKILRNHQVNNKVDENRHHNLSISVNDPVHIQPFSEVFVTEVNNELFYNEDSNVKRHITIGEEKKKVLISKSEKQSIYSNMKFKVELLSIEKQRQEIEKRKESLKYIDRSHKCEDCGLGFLTGDVFEEHRRRHVVHALLHSRVFTCLECGTRIRKWSHALTHRHKCDSARVCACVYCGKVFGNTHSLQVHVKGHTNDNKYECTECNKHFGTKQRLRVHTRLHTGFKPFICECGKKFTTKSNLKSHQNVHSRLKNHYCVECNTTYKTDRGLKKHLSESVKHARDRRTGYCVYIYQGLKLLLTR